MTLIIDPAEIAEKFQQEIKSEVNSLDEPLRVIGFLSTDGGPSITYAKYTKQACEAMGVVFDLIELPRLELEAAIIEANADETVQGIFVYYPIFNSEQDVYIRNLVDPTKDVEGLNQYWQTKLYTNNRLAVNGDTSRKAILPCTPLAIVKFLESVGEYDEQTLLPLAGKVITIFNRSEVVGRPLAKMLANDGAQVYSFDVDGPLYFELGKLQETTITRADALAQSDIIITGVPSPDFPKIQPSEVKSGVTVINFSTYANVSDEVIQQADKAVLRIGPITVVMCMRNALRLYRNFRHNRSLTPIE